MQKIKKIITESENGKIIKNGINICFIGRPNVGKSSLLNTFLEENKAIVTDISGTTRDIVEGSIKLNGILLNLIDTAGIRETEDIVEKIGVDKSLHAMEHSDLIVFVLNSNEEISEEEKLILSQIQKKKHIIFLNKNDLECHVDQELLKNEEVIFGNTLSVSGIQDLKNKIIEMFQLNELGNKEGLFLSNVRQITLAKKALKNLENVQKQIEQSIPMDILEIELKEAWNNLGLIIGESYEEELIDNLFQKFCLGK